MATSTNTWTQTKVDIAYRLEEAIAALKARLQENPSSDYWAGFDIGIRIGIATIRKMEQETRRAE